MAKFQKGKSGNPSGRKKGSKNKLTLVKDRLVKILNEKLADPKVLDQIDINTLIRFTGTILPKEQSIRVAPDIQYITHTPRPEITGNDDSNNDDADVMDVDGTCADAYYTQTLNDPGITTYRATSTDKTDKATDPHPGQKDA